MDKLNSWIKASRLPSQSYIFFPLLLGQGFYYNITRNFSIIFFILIQLFGLLIQLYIVYANDYADYEIDKTNDTFNIFSGGSRVLVENLISKKEMKKAIIIVVGLNFLLGIILTLGFRRFFSIPMITISFLLLWAYSYSPIRLSYRGGGEILQTTGVAVLLPLFGYYIQGGTFQEFPWVFLLFFFPLQLGCAMSTSLPDYPSDRKGNKRTSTVIFGFEKTKSYIIVINFISLFIFYLVAWLQLNYLKSYTVLAIPLICNLYLVYLKKRSKISSSYLDKFVAVNIFIVISLTAGNALLLFFKG
ncbi:prenyltransferase [uncultured Ilyobacter sp.]|uniref:prenyltransferase n=1 Tax=uncultured Ilyobacter sp. TaxID=544433 RepID=UPI0029C0F81C|nr:prenyltransferase [uncultured Ilyobacter sp.]